MKQKAILRTSTWDHQVENHNVYFLRAGPFTFTCLEKYSFIMMSKCLFFFVPILKCYIRVDTINRCNTLWNTHSRQLWDLRLASSGNTISSLLFWSRAVVRTTGWWAWGLNFFIHLQNLSIGNIYRFFFFFIALFLSQILRFSLLENI